MATDDLVPTRTVGRYQVVAEIGRGAMGVVYRGFDPVIGRAVALKTIRIDAGADDAEEFRQRLFREAAAAGALTHPNIVTIHDVVHDGGTTAVAMEFVDGETLAETIAREAPMSLPRAIELFEQICAGLDYAAAKGIVHRDIKPANILLGQDGRPRIADFGIARLPASTFTMSGAVLGSAGYMSPEQVRGGALDPSSDLFSAATVFYEMLSGRNPFAGTEAANTLYRIVHEMPAPIRELNPGAPAAIEAVMNRALAKDPRQRFSTGREMVAALRASASLAGTPASRAVVTSSGERSRSALMIVGLVGLAGAVGVGVYLWLRQPAALPPTPAAAQTATAAPAPAPAPTKAAAPSPAAPVAAPMPMPRPRAASVNGRDVAQTPAPVTTPLSQATSARPSTTEAPSPRPSAPMDPPRAQTESPSPVPPTSTSTAPPPAVLTPVAAAPPLAAGPQQFGSAVASVKGEVYGGVRIFLDDVQLPSPYPAQLPKVSEGSHVIKFVWTSGVLAGKELTQAFELKAGGHFLIQAVPENDAVTLRKIR